MEFQKASGLLRNAYYQGHGRYVNQIARMTLKFCKNAGGSREMRKFVETRLVDTAKANPGCVIYVKPRLFKGPVLKAEYLNGNHHHLSFHKMSCAQIEAWIKWYLTRSGEELLRIGNPISTSKPSIQGMWNPFLFRDPKLINEKFPSEELGRHKPAVPSATEQLMALYQHGNPAPSADESELRKVIGRLVDTLQNKNAIYHTDWRFNEFPDVKAHAIHATAIELITLPATPNVVGNAILDLVLSSYVNQERSTISQWMNAIGLVMTALPESWVYARHTPPDELQRQS